MVGEGRTERGNAHIRTLLANASDGFIVVDGEMTVRIMNERASSLFGAIREDVVGSSLETVGCSELTQVARCALASGEEATAQLEVGELSLGVKTARIQDGAAGTLAIIVRDDTELYRQQERAEAILAGAGDGLIVFTPDSHIAFVNPAAVELLGEELRKKVGTRISLAALLGIETEDAGQSVGPEFMIGSGSGEVTEAEITEPERRILEVRTNPVVDRSGRFLGRISTLHDVTAARELAVMKNEFVSMVSHELRTPLTSIKGYVDLIVDGEAGEINAVQREFLEIVQENSDRLVSLINDLLDISRIESGRVHLRIEPLDPRDVVSGVIDTFRTYAEQSGLTLIADIEPDLPRVAADADRVGQVLMNLTSNAVKYSPGGGSVTIRAARDGDFVNLGVSDTGIGISEDDQRQLFTKFFRVDSSLTREIGGTGLGLSICKSVVELHGGTIWVTSAEGEGSTFTFSLPVARADLVRTPSVEGPLGPQAGTVLVIDRDEEVADLVGTYLEQRGYDVVKAHTASQALAVAEAVKPALITLDVMLDAGDGFELLQHLKENPATSTIPVVVLSIVTDEGRSLRLGAADYLEKPIDKSRLMKLIDDLIGAKASPVVLVVDDDRHIVESLSHTLRAKGFAVAQAFDGREALAAVEAAPPDLILLDLRMPDIDGYQVIREVKSHGSTEHIPIVVMTAHRIDHDKIDILKLAAEHVAKPFSPETLAERVESVLRGRD